jgi:hypothetical protein
LNQKFVNRYPLFYISKKVAKVESNATVPVPVRAGPNKEGDVP